MILKRYFQIGDEFNRKRDDGVLISCELREHIAPRDEIGNRFFIGDVVADVESIYNYDYSDVVKFECDNSMDLYLANGWGEILRVYDSGDYRILDKNSFSVR
jgi:hypothetical protein